MVVAVAEPMGSHMQTVTPEASDELLVNPGRGWVIYGRADGFGEDEAAVVDLATLGYVRFGWAQLNPAEDEYNWKPIEEFLAGWAAKGKTGAFGVMAASSHSREPFVTPEWVFKAGAEYQQTQVTGRAHGRPGKKIVPDFDHPVFFAKLEKFLKAYAEKFDGDPRIEFIDIRSYGNWGEAHMSHLGGYGPISDEPFLKHVKLHRAAFKKTQLILPLVDGVRKYKSVAEWAVENGVGVRRDGVVGNSDGSETAIALGETPAVFEYYGGYEKLKKTGYWDGTDNRRGYGQPRRGADLHRSPSHRRPAQRRWQGHRPRRHHRHRTGKVETG